MMDILEKAAEILVKCGYGKERGYYPSIFGGEDICVTVQNHPQVVNPFADTLEGRKQADTIEDWIHSHRKDLIKFCKDKLIGSSTPYCGHKKRLDRIKWCLEQLAEGEQ